MTGKARNAILVLALLITVPLVSAAAAGGGGKSGGGSKSTTTTSGSSGSSGGSRVTYGSSIGVQTRYRVVTAVALTWVIYSGHSYPATRFYYDGYYDDCALRNVTAYQLGLNDSSINNVTADSSLTTLLSGSSSSTTNNITDIVAFNATLYNTTNGLVVDPLYCNYTDLNGGAAALRCSLVLAVLLAVMAIWVTGASDCGSKGLSNPTRPLCRAGVGRH